MPSTVIDKQMSPNYALHVPLTTFLIVLTQYLARPSLILSRYD